MKILQVIASINPSGGGPAEATRQLSLALKEIGHETEILTLDEPKAAYLADAPAKVYALGGLGLKYGYSAAFVPWLREHAKNYDALIVRGLWQYSGFGVWKALHKTNISYFVYPHGMLDPWFKRAYPLKHIKKMIYWLLAEYRILRDAKCILFTCEEERLLARKSFWPYKCREEVVNYGIAAPDGDVQAQKELFLNKFPQLRGKRIILFLGRIHFKKGCDLLIKAFLRVKDLDPSLHLVFAGPDDSGWKAKLENLSQRLGILDKITWTGSLSGDLKWGALQAAEVFILPSHQENFGIAVVEALACSVPVLISRKVNIWREIKAGGAGFVENDDLGGTSKLLSDWLSLSQEERLQMKENTRSCFSGNFEIHRAVDSLISVLKKYGIKG